MLCQNCQARLPAGKVLCPGCGCLNTYNISGYANTKAVQTALRTMISEQAGAIRDVRQFIAVMYDYLPEYRSECQLFKKAVDEGLLDAMINVREKSTVFKSLRNMLISKAGLGRYDAEFVLVCFAHMLGFGYASPMLEDDTADDKKDGEDSQAPAKAAPKKPKVFGKLDALRSALFAKVTIKEGYTELAAYCFENYGIMKTISLPSTLGAIGEYAFTDCKKLEDITIPSSVRKLQKGVFNACLGLKTITLPDGLLSIGDNCFFCCTSLVSLRIPDTVSSIGENAFSGCASLETLIIPKNVKFIDNNAFAYCGKLTVICTENSFVHKYCMQNGVKYRTLPMGVKLPGGDEVEGEPDE